MKYATIFMNLTTSLQGGDLIFIVFDSFYLLER